MNLTAQQEAAVAATGNVLVNAGAGTGKTRTLVERVVRRLLDPRDPVSLDEMLVVTFTEAAAAEMRQRIRARLEAEVDREPEGLRSREQLALLESAPISTLHSFCLRLVREHACDLGLDPQVKVVDEQQAAVLAGEALDGLLQDCYAGRWPGGAEAERLILEYARGWDVPVREAILRIHEHTQSRPDPQGWFEVEAGRFDAIEPTDWRRWLLEHAAVWSEAWLLRLRDLGAVNPKAAELAGILERMSDRPDAKALADALTAVLESGETWPTGRKTVLRKPLEGIFEEAGFLRSLLAADGEDPLRQDWDWVREPMRALLSLSGEFGRRFTMLKQEAGLVDFHDLEQLTLRLLWDARANAATPLASDMRRRFRLLFIDEYQDINAAQDRILTTLAGEGEAANRFIVGDVKQSIYRFRQAAPRIFQRYAGEWDGRGRGRKIHLTENFRSREEILNFVNALFGPLMRREVGGVDYDEGARLEFGAREARQALAWAGGEEGKRRVELVIHVRPGKGDGGGEEVEELQATLTETEREAHWIGRRLRALREAGERVWDGKAGTERPVNWSDMVILLRSPRLKAEAYAKEFARLGIPLEVRRSAFFDSLEVQDLLQLLTLLDNPLQDIPLLAVLRSPLVGLSVEELARVRLAARPATFWAALNRFEQVGREDPAWSRVHRFLDQFRRWRSLARQASLSQRLELVLQETGYLEWQLAQPRGDQRQANVRQLMSLARHFDDLHRQGLNRFLAFVEAQREAAGDREPAGAETGDAVRLMSIHQSKGLEFPVVVVADLGKRFNLSEAQGGLVLDEVYGLCPEVRPPGTLQSYPSLPLWLARRRQRVEACGEEMRLLYVAVTRAADRLILSGTSSGKSLEERWSDPACMRLDSGAISRAGSYLDWIAAWLGRHSGSTAWTQIDSGRAPSCSWTLVRELTPAEPATTGETGETFALPAGEEREALESRMKWTYPRPLATLRAAKTSVTALRKGLGAGVEDEAEVADPSWAAAFQGPGSSVGRGGLERGTAYHRVLEKLHLEETCTPDRLGRELERLRASGVLSQQEWQWVETGVIDRFWRSVLGQALQARARDIRRELPFTLRLTSDDLPGNPHHLPADEFVVVQGVVDLAVLGEREIWVVDYKTDQVQGEELEEKVAVYSAQIRLYGLALGQIYGRPVTQLWLAFLESGRNIRVPVQAGTPDALAIGGPDQA